MKVCQRVVIADYVYSIGDDYNFVDGSFNYLVNARDWYGFLVSAARKIHISVVKFGGRLWDI